MAKNDKDFAKLLKLMQNTDTSNLLELGVMSSPTTCNLGELELDEEDLLFNEFLLKPVLTELKIIIEPGGGDSHSHNWKDDSKYIEPLKKGDIVALVRIEAQEKYLILCKVVSA